MEGPDGGGLLPIGENMTRRRVAIIFVALVGLLVVLASLLGNIADVVFELEAERSPPANNNSGNASPPDPVTRDEPAGQRLTKSDHNFLSWRPVGGPSSLPERHLGPFLPLIGLNAPFSTAKSQIRRVRPVNVRA